jgi:hypothetical protein
MLLNWENYLRLSHFNQRLITWTCYFSLFLKFKIICMFYKRYVNVWSSDVFIARCTSIHFFFVFVFKWVNPRKLCIVIALIVKTALCFILQHFNTNLNALTSAVVINISAFDQNIPAFRLFSSLWLSNKWTHAFIILFRWLFRVPWITTDQVHRFVLAEIKRENKNKKHENLVALTN